MDIIFTKSAYRDYGYWQKYDIQKFRKIRRLLAAIEKHPFTGLGKPEALKANLQGFWSRRIDLTHRLVYRIQRNTIEVISCRYHY